MVNPDLPKSEFKALGYQVIDLLADYFDALPTSPAFPAKKPADVAALFAAPPPEHAEPVSAILADWTERILPNSSLQGSARWFGFVNGSGTQIGALAEAMAAALNANLGGWRASPAATEIERRTISWLAELIGYNADCGGVLLSGGTMANVAALRTALVATANWDVKHDGVQRRTAPLTVYMADHETHVSFVRAMDILGLGQQALRQVPSRADFTMDLAALERMLDADIAAGMTPFCLVGHCGSINVGAIDDLDALADIAARRKLWFHVDGACGALGGMLPELAHRFRGMARGDSISFDAHKWLGVPYEAGCLLVRDAAVMRQTYAMQATYLLPPRPDEYGGLNYFDYGPQLSRTWRALKIWMSLRYYGAEGYRTFFRQTIACAKHLHRLVQTAEDFEVVQPEPDLYIYAFRYAPHALRGNDAALDDLNQRIADELQTRQIAFAMTTRIHGRVTQRLSICSHRTTVADIDATFAAMRAIGEELRSR
ncbi:MAG TPA: pyridoxal-dependent decarboxylase [Gemmatimonadales bacterium]|nr:pyridoxal-dependent decarboxylase [Gemmatimonadales bacterium]